MITLQERVHSAPKPKGWELGKLHHTLKARRGNKNTGMVEDNLLSLSYGRIVRRNIDAIEGLLPESFETYQIVEDGDIIMRLTDLQNDKRSLRQGLVTERGIITSAYDALRALRDNDPRFWAYSLLALDLAKYYYSLGGGVRQSVKFSDFPNDWIYRPDLPTQKQIAAFLDRETERIDELIEKKERLMHGFAPRLEALVASAISDKSLPRVRFEHLAERMQREVNLSEHEGLVRLGLYNRGRGIFHKPAADKEDMGVSSFFFVEAGDLILSGQFAWEGSVAQAGIEETGCVVSHRYPIYKGRSVETSYLLALFRSRYGDFILNDASRGSAGRNRPLNTWRLGKEKLPVPSKALQEQIKSTVSAEAKLRSVHSASIDGLREYRAALITAAVTGQIDVDTYGKSGATSATLDKIEEEMQA